MEVFRSPAEIPPEFSGPNAGCGVIVLCRSRPGQMAHKVAVFRGRLKVEAVRRKRMLRVHTHFDAAQSPCRDRSPRRR